MLGNLLGNPFPRLFEEAIELVYIDLKRKPASERSQVKKTETKKRNAYLL